MLGGRAYRIVATAVVVPELGYVTYGIVTENVNDRSAGRMLIQSIVPLSCAGILADVGDSIIARLVLPPDKVERVSM